MLDSYTLLERFQLYKLQVVLKLYKKFQPVKCSKFCENIIIQLVVSQHPIEELHKISFLVSVLKRYTSRAF